MDIDISKIRLEASSHSRQTLRPDAPEALNACAMEWVSVLAEEPWSDSPQCACPVVAAFVRSLNDRIKDTAMRTRLLAPLVPGLLNTRSTRAVEIKRAYVAADYACREAAPRALELRGYPEHAAQLRALDPIVGEASAKRAEEVARAAASASAYAASDASDAAYAAYASAYAASDAASDASASAAAAYDAASDAAYAASAYAAASAAYASAADAASAYAAAAAYDAASDAAYAADAASAAREAEYARAVELVRRMIAVTA